MSYYWKSREVLLKYITNITILLVNKKLLNIIKKTKKKLRKKREISTSLCLKMKKNVIRKRSKDRYHKNKEELKKILSKI